MLGLPGKTFTLTHFFLLNGFSKAALAEQGSCHEPTPQSFSFGFPSSFFFLPFFVCLRGVKDECVFNSQSFYLKICLSLKHHFSHMTVFLSYCLWKYTMSRVQQEGLMRSGVVWAGQVGHFAWLVLCKQDLWKCSMPLKCLWSNHSR